ncbi:MAG: DNA polymerase III subunit delta' [Thermoanaerobacterales bacterium]|nr:DNA polymerase III subunit delta' [Thermoanaerobacterales bacterium]
MSFSEVIGQQIVRRALQAALRNGRVAQAYLFYGPPGVGKRMLARAFARTLLCAAPAGGDEACGGCRDCRLALAGTHPDWHRVSAETKSIGIGAVRELQHAMRYRPYGKRHVVTLEGAERLTAEAANALLKTLEEPSGPAVFLLVTDQPDSLLPTVRSRCLGLPCRPLAKDEVLEGLARHGFSGERTAVWAARCEGSLGRALALARGEDDAEGLAQAVWLAGEIDRMGIAELLAVAGETRTRDELARRLEWFSLWYRDLLWWRETGTADGIVNADRLEEIREQSARLGSRALAARVAAVEEARARLAANANPRLLAEVLYLEIKNL